MGRENEHSTSFRCDAAAYRPGVPVLSEPCLTDDLKEEYDRVPPIIWAWVRRLFVTGRVGSAEQLRMHLKHVCMNDVREELLLAYLWKHREEIFKDREIYLRTLHTRMLESDIERCSDPAAEREHRVQENLLMMVDAMIMDAIDNKRWMRPQDVAQMAKTLDLLRSSSVSKGSRSKNPTRSVGKGGDMEEFKGVLDRLMNMQKGQNLEADDKLDKYIRRTKDLVDPEDKENDEDG